jgi:hypothetical protein
VLGFERGLGFRIERAIDVEIAAGGQRGRQLVGCVLKAFAQVANEFGVDSRSQRNAELAAVGGLETKGLRRSVVAGLLTSDEVRYGKGKFVHARPSGWKLVTSGWWLMKKGGC